MSESFVYQQNNRIKRKHFEIDGIINFNNDSFNVLENPVLGGSTKVLAFGSDGLFWQNQELVGSTLENVPPSMLHVVNSSGTTTATRNGLFYAETGSDAFKSIDLPTNNTGHLLRKKADGSGYEWVKYTNPVGYTTSEHGILVTQPNSTGTQLLYTKTSGDYFISQDANGNISLKVYTPPVIPEAAQVPVTTTSNFTIVKPSSYSSDIEVRGQETFSLGSATAFIINVNFEFWDDYLEEYQNLNHADYESWPYIILSFGNTQLMYYKYLPITENHQRINYLRHVNSDYFAGINSTSAYTLSFGNINHNRITFLTDIKISITALN